MFKNKECSENKVISDFSDSIDSIETVESNSTDSTTEPKIRHRINNQWLNIFPNFTESYRAAFVIRETIYNAVAKGANHINFAQINCCLFKFNGVNNFAEFNVAFNDGDPVSSPEFLENVMYSFCSDNFSGKMGAGSKAASLASAPESFARLIILSRDPKNPDKWFGKMSYSNIKTSSYVVESIDNIEEVISYLRTHFDLGSVEGNWVDKANVIVLNPYAHSKDIKSRCSAKYRHILGRKNSKTGEISGGSDGGFFNNTVMNIVSFICEASNMTELKIKYFSNIVFGEDTKHLGFHTIGAKISKEDAVKKYLKTFNPKKDFINAFFDVGDIATFKVHNLKYQHTNSDGDIVWERLFTLVLTFYPNIYLYRDQIKMYLKNLSKLLKHDSHGNVREYVDSFNYSLNDLTLLSYWGEKPIVDNPDSRGESDPIYFTDVPRFANILGCEWSGTKLNNKDTGRVEFQKLLKRFDFIKQIIPEGDDYFVLRSHLLIEARVIPQETFEKDPDSSLSTFNESLPFGGLNNLFFSEDKELYHNFLVSLFKIVQNRREEGCVDVRALDEYLKEISKKYSLYLPDGRDYVRKVPVTVCKSKKLDILDAFEIKNPLTKVERIPIDYSGKPTTFKFYLRSRDGSELFEDSLIIEKTKFRFSNIPECNCDVTLYKSKKTKQGIEVTLIIPPLTCVTPEGDLIEVSKCEEFLHYVNVLRYDYFPKASISIDTNYKLYKLSSYIDVPSLGNSGPAGKGHLIIEEGWETPETFCKLPSFLYGVVKSNGRLLLNSSHKDVSILRWANRKGYPDLASKVDQLLIEAEKVANFAVDYFKNLKELEFSPIPGNNEAFLDTYGKDALNYAVNMALKVFFEGDYARSILNLVLKRVKRGGGFSEPEGEVSSEVGVEKHMSEGS